MGVFLLLGGCTSNDSSSSGGADDTGVVAVPLAQTPPGCQGCHPVSLGKNHDFPCADCHLGDVKASDKKLAHKGLTKQPAHPDRMTRFCGRCHGEIVEQVAKSIHFTAANEVNLVRQAFGSTEALASLTEIPRIDTSPGTPLQLVDDLLRRRCLRCHVYSSGEAYPAIVHGTGCAACHLAFANGSLADHGFLAKPTDQQCLSCHYGNRVGADYYGRFDHDVNWEYRTPLYAGEEKREPYGLGYHQLAPDLHQQAGMVCIDCHGGNELMAGKRSITCLSCHGDSIDQNVVPVDVRENSRELVLANGKVVSIPVMTDPAHQRHEKKVGCQVCHAQWTFADYGNHLIRIDDPDYELWEGVTRQGSAEVELRLETALYLDGGDNEVVMGDGITGRTSPGIWLQAYELRRWEDVNTCFDRQGILQVCRPLLDLHLSYSNDDGDVVFDGITPESGKTAMTPYTPHTTGKAGKFYQQRLIKLELP